MITAENPVPSREEYDEAKRRLREFIVARLEGKCKILSEGHDCKCALCDFDRMRAYADSRVPERSAAVALISQQLFDEPRLVPREDMPSYPMTETLATGRLKGGQFHYGVQELRELLDFIYGGPPKDDTERIPRNKVAT